jgi:hypothetical protein
MYRFNPFYCRRDRDEEHPAHHNLKALSILSVFGAITDISGRTGI